jgi:hypothetical protein
MSFEFRLGHNGKTSGRVTMMVNATSVVTQHRLDPNASHREAILYVALQLYHLFWRPSQSQVVKTQHSFSYELSCVSKSNYSASS